MEEIKPDLPESRYAPLSYAEFLELKGVLDSIRDVMPEDKAPLIWNSFNAVRGANETRPCTCGSAGAHWGRAVTHLKEWVKSKL
jgi:hypothetical protein